MVKIAKILFLSFLFVQVSLASERVVKFEDFVHFSKPQKIEALELVHTFLIEYESAYSKKLIQDSKKQKRYQTYKKIFNFFVNSAYAADGIEFSRDALDSNKLCYYAGWISMRTVVNGQSICQHPKKLAHIAGQSSIAMSNQTRSLLRQVSSKYEKSINQSPVTLKVNSTGFSFDNNPRSCNPNSGDIVCNPTIFGLKSGSSICVPGNSSIGLNSSLLCNQALNTIKENDPEEYAVTIDGILNNSVGKNKDEFFLIMDAMYDTCLCGKDATQPSNGERFRGTIDARYAEVIFNQRTCFGIINQTEHIYSALSSLPSDSAVCSSFAQTPLSANTGGINWLNYLSDAYEQIQQQEISSKLAGLISNQRQSLDQPISQSDRDRVRVEEDALVSQMRDQHFEEYIAAGLCPDPSERSDADISVGNSDEGSEGSGDSDGSNLSITGTPTNGPSGGDIKVGSGEERVPTRAKGTVPTTTPIDATPTNTDNDVKYELKIEKFGAENSNTVFIIATMTRGPDPFTNSVEDQSILDKIELKIKEGDTANPLVVRNFDNRNESDEPTSSTDTNSSSSSDTAEPALANAEIDSVPKDSEATPQKINQRAFIVMRQTNSFNVQGFAQIDGDNVNSSGEILIPGTVSPKPARETADATSDNDRCTLTILKENKGTREVKLTAKIKMIDENGEEKTSIVGQEGSSEAEIAWYQETTTDAPQVSARKRVTGTIDPGPEEAESNESESAEYVELNGLSVINETIQGEIANKVNPYNIARPTQKTIYGVKVSIPGVCEKAQKIEVEGLGTQNLGNNNPYQAPSQLSPTPGGGGILGGQR